MSLGYIPPKSSIYFVGIGGIGMSGIAEILFKNGYQVEGSDIALNQNIKRLQALGIPVHIGHKDENLKDPQVVVVSTAIAHNNPELLKAKAQRIPILQRAEMLAELVRLKKTIAISGTHGKTTTTSLMGALFEEAGVDPTIINGGIINAYKTNMRFGQGDWAILEADESDGSFLKFFPKIAVVTNIDPEHLDFYKTFENVKKSFHSFIHQVPFYGFSVLCYDHPEVRALCCEGRRFITYGFSKGADCQGLNIKPAQNGSFFDVDYLGKPFIQDLFLPMAGQHNIQNALAVIAVAIEVGFSQEIIRSAFEKFKGIQRRFTKVGEFNGATIIDDYAHHPTEIEHVIKAARQTTSGRIFALAQPHRYSRLQNLFHEFVDCFQGVDGLFLTPVYAAGEEPIDGVNSSFLAESIREKNNIPFVQEILDPTQIAKSFYTLVQKDDVVLCMGAGNITSWAASLEEQLYTLSQDFYEPFQKQTGT